MMQKYGETIYGSLYTTRLLPGEEIELLGTYTSDGKNTFYSWESDTFGNIVGTEMANRIKFIMPNEDTTLRMTAIASGVHSINRCSFVSTKKDVVLSLPYGQTGTISPDSDLLKDHQFAWWYNSQTGGNYTSHAPVASDLTQPDVQITMGDHDWDFYQCFKGDSHDTYNTLAVNHGHVEGGGAFFTGYPLVEVTVIADDPEPGYRFKEWTGSLSGMSGPERTNATAKTTVVNGQITATYSKLATVHLVNRDNLGLTEDIIGDVGSTMILTTSRYVGELEVTEWTVEGGSTPSYSSRIT